MRLFLAVILLLPVALQAAGLGVYNPAQHAVNGFMPTQLPDLQLWLDANKIGLTNGASVDVWQDFSGRSNWATNGTGSKQPTVGQINGRNAILFDGVDDWMAVSNFKCQTYVTVFCVVRMVNAQNKNFFLEHGINATSDPGFWFYGEDYPWGFYRVGSHYSQGVKWGTNVPIVCHLTYDGNGRYYRNGIELSKINETGTSRANSLITNTFNLGARNGASFISNGNYSEVLIYTNVITDKSKIDSINRYLGTKYGIVVQ